MDYPFSELIDFEQVKGLTDAFYEATGFASAIIDLDGQLLIGSGMREICMRFHRLHPETEKLCKQSDRFILNQLQAGRPHYIHKCPHGLIDAAAPIIVDGRQLASYFTGQFLLKTPTDADFDFFRARAKRYGFNTEAYMEALSRVPIVGEEQIQSILSFLSRFAGFIAEMSRVNKKEKKNARILASTVESIEVQIADRTRALQEANRRLTIEIEKQKQTEQALRESEERFRRLHEASMGALGIHENGLIIDVNQAIVDLTGYDRNELIGMDGLTLIAEEWRETVRQNIRSGYSIPYGVVGLKKGGLRYPLEIQGKNFRYGGRNLRVTEFRDITERKRSEQKIIESEERYRMLVETADDAIYIAQDGIIKFPNPKALELAGASPEVLANTPFMEFIHENDRSFVWERHQRRLRGEDIPTPYTFRLLPKTGGVTWVEINTARITWEGRPAILSILRDVTRQKRLESQLHQAQKMEAVGKLAGGLAHDFNNILMGIQGRASLMSMDPDLCRSSLEHLDGIEEYVKSAADITKQLLGFAKGGDYEVRPVDINDLIHKTAEMFGRTRKDISLYFQLQTDLWTVEADIGRIEQVLLNLLLNAWEAMPGGGDITLKTENVVLSPENTAPFGLEAGKYVKISVADTGVGMDPEVRKRVFEPFFTTKGTGRGTGLGLASTYGIVKSHNGIIQVYSEKGRGTTFTIHMPASIKTVALTKQSPSYLYEGSGTILLVDDEEMILTVGIPMLQQLGYTVWTAKSGEVAADLYRLKREAVDLVILDMVMPGMDGEETFRRLKSIDPAAKILLSSGYGLNEKARAVMAQGCDGFIQKPFNVSELSKKVREILDAAKSPSGTNPTLGNGFH